MAMLKFRATLFAAHLLFEAAVASVLLQSPYSIWIANV
jgi:hypothetical protein